ncbi:extracellular solute-binding protein [Corynebacterium otitidis]|uniref:sn-glycerol-3-phosphate-binding periplasmic protein n=1 Tax=Corynebacterium otitidis ATCC 51513 TaxID=883169 RepID=I7JWJ4_9CORY|nr:extracellular solute-binding protein [Corynebacterium otitidis]EJZ81625.1 hypothetical protein HMPREF9719_01446 [Corynebacterium otitidis ATCC 51513]CCI83891.1 sn-glycerol-3-phosphate-binding periplasmic protein [Corynebacterium otitidis ATCC 51513]
MIHAKETGALVLGAALAAGAAGCTQGDAEADRNEEGATVVSLWHSSGGAAGRALDSMVASFNEQHRGEIEVRPVYQGDYNDSMAKFVASVQTGDLPALMQANNVETAFMKDSGVITPVEELNERYGGFDFDGLVSSVRNYYEMDDTMYAMPAMISQPVMYVNDDLLAEAGLDASDFETTEELVESSRKINDELGVAGFTFPLDGWFMEQSASMRGVELCSPGNGVGSERAQRFATGSDPVVDLWDDYEGLYASGAAHNPGIDNEAAAGAFLTGQAAIHIGTSGGFGNLMANEPSFNWSVHRLPRDNDAAGAIPGGNSLWAVALGHDEEVQRAAWEFMSYVGSDEVQAELFRDTGYLPTAEGALEELDDVDDNQKAMLGQLHSNPVNDVTAGCHSGALNSALRDFERAMSSIANGEDAAETLEATTEEADDKIDTYNERAELTHVEE